MTSSKPHTNEQNNLGNGNLRFQRPVISIASPSIELLNKIKETGEVLHSFEIPYSVSIVAGHIATRKTLKYIDELESKEIEVIIACGIGSAHLPGMIASLTTYLSSESQWSAIIWAVLILCFPCWRCQRVYL